MGKKARKKGRTTRGGTKPKKKQTRVSEASSSNEPKVTSPVTTEGRWSVLGLVNLTNTCYFNSAVQLLLSSVFLQEVFARPNIQNSAAMSSLTAAMCELYAATRTAVKGIQFKPNRVLGFIRNLAPSFKNRGQHDAHELLITMLHHLVEEAKTERGENWMDAYFDGTLISTITCNTCHYTKSKEEAFIVLSVSVVKDGNIIEDGTAIAEAVSSFPLAANDVTAESVVEIVELPDVVERNDPEAKLHLDPSTSVDASTSMQYTTDPSDNEDGIDGIQDLFFVPEEFEEVIDNIDNVSNGLKTVSLSDSLTENLTGVSATNSAVDTADAVNWKENFIDDSMDEWMQFKYKKTKGKKGKKGKRQNRFEGLQLGDDDQESTIDVERFQTVNACLLHFFSPESVTWRCTKEYPERKVRFNTTPEVFVLPPSKESRGGHWKSHSDDPDSSETSSEEGSTPESSSKLEDIRTGPTPGLKSCLRTQNRLEWTPLSSLNSVKRYRLWKPPKILCIHLKRFEAVHRRGITKLQHPVQFEQELDLVPYMDPTSPHIPPSKYALRAVVCHSGGVNFGHYTAFVSRANGEDRLWYDGQAYILLYEASETTPRSL